MITSYEFGKVVIDGNTYTRDVIVSEGGVDATWWRRESHALGLADLEPVLAAKPEVIVVGTGMYGVLEVLPEVRAELAKRGIELIAVPTGEACSLYNALVKKGRRVVAALHLTC